MWIDGCVPNNTTRADRMDRKVFPDFVAAILGASPKEGRLSGFWMGDLRICHEKLSRLDRMKQFRQ